MMTTDFERWKVRVIALVAALGLLAVGCAQTWRSRGLTVVADTDSMTSAAGGSSTTRVRATTAIPSAPAPLPAVTVFDAFAVPNSPATIWAVTSRGRLEHSNDAAASWKDVTPFAAGQILVNQQFANPSSAWLVSELPGNGGTPAAAVSLWHTQDGGTTWKSSTLNTQAPARVFVSFVDERTGWIGIGLAGRDVRKKCRVAVEVRPRAFIQPEILQPCAAQRRLVLLQLLQLRMAARPQLIDENIVQNACGTHQFGEGRAIARGEHSLAGSPIGLT